ncbi:MAG: hypoxanthine phosphoribosyltransferase [Actinomycetes bacterium]
MQPKTVANEISEIIVTEDQIRLRITELAKEIDAEYRDKNVLVLGVLKGAVMFMADLSRALEIQVQMDWMAVSSYGSGTVSSGVVRILKDLDADVSGRHILVVEDIIDSGLTLSWLVQNLETRGAASVEVVALLRKPEAVKVDLKVRWVGFDIPNEFVVGFGLDWNERYRNLTGVGILKPEVYS